MKKIVLILCAMLLVMCKSKQATTGPKAEKETVAAKTNVQYRDDFRSVSDKDRAVYLKDMKAADKEFSVLIFTRGYKGEGIQVSNSKKVLFSGNVMSNLRTGIAKSIRLDNTVDTKIFDSFTKKAVVLESDETKKHKFIYVLKDNSNKSHPFYITYSNTLRPLK